MYNVLHMLSGMYTPCKDAIDVAKLLEKVRSSMDIFKGGKYNSSFRLYYEVLTEDTYVVARLDSCGWDILSTYSYEDCAYLSSPDRKVLSVNFTTGNLKTKFLNRENEYAERKQQVDSIKKSIERGMLAYKLMRN